VVRYVVRRTPVVLTDADGEPILQVTDEEVSVHAGRRLTGRFREVVLQPGSAACDGLLAAVEATLLSAGAVGRETVPRSVRVLGPAAAAGPDLPAASATDGAGAAWSGALRDASSALIVADAHLRLDATGAVARPSLAMVDRVLGLALLLGAPASTVAPLTDLRALLVSVEIARHRSTSAHAGPRGGSGAAPDGVLAVAAQPAAASTLGALHRHLDSDAHATAVRGLLDLCAAPGLADDEAGGPVRTSVSVRVGAQWRELASGLRPDAPGSPGRLAELAAGASVAPGKAPARFAAAATAAAEAARAHARAVDVQQWLEATAAGLPPHGAFAAGRAAGLRAGEPARATEGWAAALTRLERPKVTGWLAPDNDEGTPP
jgi:hypothetical protein